MNKIEFFFDFMSPFAYLAHEPLHRIAAEYGYEVDYQPIDLREAKRAAGNTGPPNIEIPPKIKYLMVDLQRWATRYGLPFKRIKSLACARVNKGTFWALDHDQAYEYTKEAYRLLWGMGSDPDDDQLLSAIAQTMGWDPGVFLEFLVSQDAEQRYGHCIDAAIGRGIFGVPIMCVDDQMWWGNDRLDFLTEYLAARGSEESS